MKYLYYIFVFLISFQALADQKVSQILEKMDQLYKSKSSVAKIQMTIINPNWKREMKLEAWTEGLENSFITILYPHKDKGISTLKKENQMWNYFPKINKVIKIPPSMMMGSWMGSDFTNDDLVKENTYLNDHVAKLIQENDRHYEIELTPKKETVSVWSKVILLVAKKRIIPVKETFYNEKNEKVREIVFEKIEKIQGKYIPMKLTLTPLLKTGHKTIVEYLSIKFNVKVSNRTFTLSNLKKRR